MAVIDHRVHLTSRPETPAEKRARERYRSAGKTARAEKKLHNATAKAAKRAARQQHYAEAITPEERRERERVLRDWWSQHAAPFADKLKESEFEAFYDGCRNFFITRTLDHAAWRKLCVAFRAATTHPTEPDPNYWKHHARAPHSALPDGW
jgi:hypothetical protein